MSLNFTVFLMKKENIMIIKKQEEKRRTIWKVRLEIYTKAITRFGDLNLALS